MQKNSLPVPLQGVCIVTSHILTNSLSCFPLKRVVMLLVPFFSFSICTSEWVGGGEDVWDSRVGEMGEGKKQLRLEC